MVKSYVICKQEFLKDGKNVIVYDLLYDGGGYSVLHPEEHIFRSIYEQCERYISHEYDESCIRTLMKLQSDGRYGLETNEDNHNRKVSVIADKKNNRYGFSIKSLDENDSLSETVTYEIKQIEEIDIVYLVAEFIVNPSDDCNLVVRCEHKYFTDIYSAKKYLARCKEDYKLSHGDFEFSGFKIFPASKSEIEDMATPISYWYTRNIEATRLIYKHGLDAEDFRYIPDIDEVSDKIAAFAYDDLDDEGKYNIDSRIYDIAIKFISDEKLRTYLDSLRNTAKTQHNVMKTVREKVVILSLINAESKEKFHQIYKALGETYDWCIGEVTDDIWTKHSHASNTGETIGDGYILIDKYGELVWFPECLWFDEWDKSDDSPYKGKFMLNEADTLLCLREYHPEKIADKILSQDECDMWHIKYMNNFKAKILQHDEMEFSEIDSRDGRGHSCKVAAVTGRWYPHGINISGNCDAYSNTQFLRHYYNYEFTKDECRQLLSGEEIVIKNYVTKDNGIRCTIRGRLNDVSSAMDSDPIIRFVRTDIDVQERNAVNAKYGIYAPPRKYY